MGRWIARVCRALAIAAGVILVAMALMSLASIVGRTLFGKPITGDYELVQMMCAAAVSLTLPYAHWAGGHVIVDFLTARASPGLRLLLDSVADMLMAFAGAVMCMRLAVGMMDLRRNMDSSMLLGLPTWWGYAPMVVSFGMLTLTAGYILVARIMGANR